MSEKVWRRARQSRTKLERRSVILEATEYLFAEGRGELPSVQAIADRAGVAKGTVYLYFATIEELFFTLLAEHAVKWLSQSRETLQRSRSPLTPEKAAAAAGEVRVITIRPGQRVPAGQPLATVSAEAR